MNDNKMSGSSLELPVGNLTLQTEEFDDEMHQSIQVVCSLQWKIQVLKMLQLASHFAEHLESTAAVGTPVPDKDNVCSLALQ